jgi:hyperosmotically inducible protein
VGTVLAERWQRQYQERPMKGFPFSALAAGPPIAAAALTVLLAALPLAGCDQRSMTASNGAPPQTPGAALDDAVITTKVKAAIVTDRDAKGADTSVQTRKGEVMLSGFVDNQAQIDRQLQLAKAVQGVQSVDNELMVRSNPPTAGSLLDDSVITVKVKTALLSDTHTKGNEIAVNTNKGVVLLSGFVDSADEQARATSVARNVEGVQSVVNDTRVKQ